MPTVNAISNSVLKTPWAESLSPSTQLLRRWWAPATILAVTNIADEEVLLFHAIQQARRTGAKVILVHVLQTKNVQVDAGNCAQSSKPGGMAESALASLNRMARQLRWAGIPCEPLLLRGAQAKEVPLVAKARNADRILMAAACEKPVKKAAATTLAEELLSAISVPICTVGQVSPAAPGASGRVGQITLALSLRSDPGVALAFASRLAHEQRSKLTVMHVFGDEEKGRKDIERSPLAFASQLPADAVGEAELLCPLQIAVRKGDPATEILKSAGCTNQDFIVLGPVGQPQPVPAGRWSTVHRVIGAAQCPVILLGNSVRVSAQGQRDPASFPDAQ